MQIHYRPAIAVAAILALCATGGLVGSTASAQPPASDTTAPESDEAIVDAASEEDASEEAPEEALVQSGSEASVPAPQEPEAISPDTAPLGSSGGGGTGGNGRPTQDPIKDG